MFDFIKYVLWELKNSMGLVILAVAAAGLILGACWFAHKRKYKGSRKFPLGKALLWVVFIGYLAIVFYATILRSSFGGREWNLHLFRAWREAWNSFSAKTWANVLLNVAMFVPLGFLLPLLFKPFRKWYITIPAGFAVSLAIELVQLVVARGICDVDDLFANTQGAAIGFFFVMFLLSFFDDKHTKLRKILWNAGVFLALVGSICMIFVVYGCSTYGNLPVAAAYRNDTGDVVWEISFSVPEVPNELPVYRTQSRTIADCDRFAEEFRKIIGTEYNTVSYYEEAAYSMDQNGDENGVHFLHVFYLNPGYEYSFTPKSEKSWEEPDWKDGDRESLEAALFKYPVLIPEYASFCVEGDGWYSFTVNRYVDGANMVDGTLRCRFASDGTIRELKNELLCYNYYDVVEVISPEEACESLQNGFFNDGGYFEYIDPKSIEILSCELGYEIDTKGFYQPVYCFRLKSEDGAYQNEIFIPAMK